MNALFIVFAATASASTGIDPAWIAVIGAVFGGAGLKITEAWLGRSKIKIDDASQIRNELRLEITSQREEIRVLELELHKWREEYYALREKYLTLQLDLLKKVDNIKHEVEDAERSAVEIEKMPPMINPSLTDEAKE